MLKSALIVLIVTTVQLTVTAGNKPDIIWNFNGSLDNTSGNMFSPVMGKARYAPAEDLPGTDGLALAIGAIQGDAQYFRIDDPGSARLGASYTVEAWILPTRISPQWNRLLLNWSGEKRYHLAIHQGRLSLYHAQADGKEIICETGMLSAWRWHHIVAVAERNEEDPGNSRLTVWLNGKPSNPAIYDGTCRQSKGMPIGLGDAADGSGASMRYRGYIDSLAIWKRPLSASEILARFNQEKAALKTPQKIFMAGQSPFQAVMDLEYEARMGTLSDELAEAAVPLLRSNDIFVRAIAEWALSQKIGYENSGGTCKWPGHNPPEWLKTWERVSKSDQVAFDWIRHALDRQILTDAKALKTDIKAILKQIRITEDHCRIEKTQDQRELLKFFSEMTDKSERCEELRPIWLDAHRALRGVVFRRQELNFQRLLFHTRYMAHHKPNVCGVHYNWVHKPGGDISILNGLDRGRVEGVLNGRLGPGHIHGLDLWFDGDRVAFGWAEQKNWPPKQSDGQPYDLCHVQNNYAYELMKITEPVHLYEASLDGRSIKRLTHDDYWSDLEPAYLPDNSIAFSSDRSGHSPGCDGWENDITDTNIYRLSADRKHIRRLTNQKDIDIHPHLLNNGQIGYLRWEYTERSFWNVHSFWIVRPDGTMADSLYKQHMVFPFSVRHVRSIPDSSALIAIAAGHHCYPVGPLVTINPGKGMNNPDAMEIMAMGSLPEEGRMAGIDREGVRDSRGYYSYPLALSKECSLVTYSFGSNGILQRKRISNDGAIYFVDTLGNKELIFRDSYMGAISAMPLIKRTPPPILPDAADYRKNHAVCVVPDVYEGMKDIERGTIRHIRIMESLPWPVTVDEGARYWGGQSFRWRPHQEYRYSPVRVIGTVPVETDGSAHFKVPAVNNASVFFQALDANHMEIQRMRSSVSFQPGETRSCNGCHETRSNAAARGQGVAAGRAPDMPVPPEWGMKPLGYEWMVQPVLQKHCAECHGGDKPEAGLDLSDAKHTQFGKDSMLSSYFNIRNKNLIACSNQEMNSDITTIKQFGSHRSRLIQQLFTNTEHAKRRKKLSPAEWYRIVTWVDANCPYHDTMYNKRPENGGEPVREHYPWKDPWGAAEEFENQPKDL